MTHHVVEIGTVASPLKSQWSRTLGFAAALLAVVCLGSVLALTHTSTPTAVQHAPSVLAAKVAPAVSSLAPETAASGRRLLEFTTATDYQPPTIAAGTLVTLNNAGVAGTPVSLTNQIPAVVFRTYDFASTLKEIPLTFTCDASALGKVVYIANRITTENAGDDPTVLTVGSVAGGCQRVANQLITVNIYPGEVGRFECHFGGGDNRVSCPAEFNVVRREAFVEAGVDFARSMAIAAESTAYSALTTANLGSLAAIDARITANSALTTANLGSLAAIDARITANSALTTANLGSLAAIDARITANSALTTANLGSLAAIDARITANSALTTANLGSLAAIDARITANSALTTANLGSLAAIDARITANSALTTANLGSLAAIDARATAVSALDQATSAMSTASAAMVSVSLEVFTRSSAISVIVANVGDASALQAQSRTLSKAYSIASRVCKANAYGNCTP